MTAHDISRSEEGFTLVELLVATTMALIVFTATLSMFGVFNDARRILIHRNAAQNQARLGVDQIVSQLRNVANSASVPSFVLRASSYDLVFQAPTPSGGSQLVRYCVPPDPSPGSPGTEVLVTQTQTPAPSTVPWSSSACPDPAYSSSILVPSVTNRYAGLARPVFSFNGGAAPSNLSSISSVGIDLFVNATPADTANTDELQSSALLRNAQQSPVAAFSWSQGQSGTVVLDAGSSYSPTGQSLTDAWSCKTTAGATVACPGSSSSTYEWSPSTGTGSYNVTLTVTDQAGLTATVTHLVTVS